MTLLNLILVSALIASIDCYIIKPGPAVVATKGEVWPKPQYQIKSQDYFEVRPQIFSFDRPDNIGCLNFLNEALKRYWTIISESASYDRRGRLREQFKRSNGQNISSDGDNEYFLGYLDSLKIKLNGKCIDDDVRPDFDMVENYTLSISAFGGILTSSSIWGIFRGLETFSQSIYLENDKLIINATAITDSPRFPYRGLLLDTSRHFMPLYAIYQTLDAMSFNKLNVFHWHITDDQSFPYKSKTFPELSDQGAYHRFSKVYEQSDIQNVINYARHRGIRVISEFDTPGHTRSWGVSHPELLTECYNDKDDDEGPVKNGLLGPMDPTKEETYTFLNTLFTEVVNVFPDSYFHIGGDEVEFDCWRSNPEVAKFMQKNNISTYEKLESYFIQKVIKILDNLQSNYLVWEEVFTNGVDLPKKTLVHVWRQPGQYVLYDVTMAGKYAIFSSCWYLDHLYTGGDWEKFYNCDPQDFNGTDAQKKLILGGEACMWSETVNEFNVISRVWPRASAAAEKLWSVNTTKDLDNAKKRLEEHTCRMNHRGIQAQPPNGPGVCL